MKRVILFAAALALFAQTRGIVPEEVVKARPAAQAKTAAKSQSAPPPKYHALSPEVTSSLRERTGSRQVGVTIWRLRPAAATDSGARILVQEDSSSVEWVPERVSSNAALKQGDRVRLTFESPQTGFLYVIDRERYASGERSLPYLIFPTTRTRGGENAVAGGKLIDIPAQEDRPNFFTLRQGRPDQTEEELTVLLTPVPLEGVEIGSAAQKLTNEQVAGWERKWGTGQTELFELTGGEGTTWTTAEQQAASGATRLLTQEDPPPQTVYRIVAKPDDPVLIKVHLRYTGTRSSSPAKGKGKSK